MMDAPKEEETAEKTGPDTEPDTQCQAASGPAEEHDNSGQPLPAPDRARFFPAPRCLPEAPRSVPRLFGAPERGCYLHEAK